VTWAAVGAANAVAAASVRAWAVGGQVSSWGTVAIGVFFTVAIMLTATLGISALLSRRRHLSLLSGQQVRLLELRSQAEGFAAVQSQALASIINDVVAPEIDRLRQQVSSLGAEPAVQRLEELREDISTYSSTMVRSISHDVVRPALPDRHDNPSTSSVAREIIDVVLSARLNIPLTAIAGFMLFLAQANLGCAGLPAAAVVAFLSVNVLLGLVGRLRPLTNRPWGFLWLIATVCLGFTAYRLVLESGPPQCSWVDQGVESTVATAAAVIMFLGLTAVIEGARQTTAAVRELESTNAELARATRALNDAGAVTHQQISDLLHGPVQGRLAAVSLALRIYLDDVQRGQDPSAAELHDHITRLLDQAADDVALLSGDSGALAQISVSSLAEIGDSWRGLLDVEVDISEASVALLQSHPDLTDRIYQSAEEALTNASRHGSARHARIDITTDTASSVTLTVSDDGLGLSETPQEGLGLHSLAASGAVLTLVNGSQGGTVLRATWPVS